MERFKIFPSIGIARMGGSEDQFFVCAEKEGSLGIEIDSSGNEIEVQNFKDANGLIKRQGARFRVFELDEDTGEYRPFELSAGMTIEWKVELANKKSGVVRPSDPPTTAPTLPLSLKAHSSKLIISPGEKSITGKSQNGVSFNGKYDTEDVFLGELQTDKMGNLIVLGGRGISKSPHNEDIVSYYFTEDWYDDASDGPVKATVKFADDSEVEALSAWVLVGPPDFAPAVRGIVTLYDIMEAVAAIPSPAPVSYANHVKPLIDRFKNLGWVSRVTNFSISQSDAVLSDTSEANKPVRRNIRKRIVDIENTLAGHTNGTLYRLTDNQKDILNKWKDGIFVDDHAAPSPTQRNAADQLTKTVLDSTVGQGFCPGIEGGIIVQNKSIYAEPFRFDVAKVGPGDITALMALPWQADFLECNTNWWPSQRPDSVFQGDGTREQWQRDFPADDPHEFLVANFNKMGFVKPSGNQQVESERGTF